MTGDDLRQRAGRVFDQQHPGRLNVERRQERESSIRERQIGRDIPNGPGTVLRASWRSYKGGAEDFSIRGWIVDPFGDMVPMTGFGLNVSPAMLPSLAVAIAEALDQLEVTAGGLRVRSAPPAGSAGDGSSTSARTDDKRGRSWSR